MAARVAVTVRMVAGDIFITMSPTISAMWWPLPFGALRLRAMSVGSRMSCLDASLFSLANTHDAICSFDTVPLIVCDSGARRIFTSTEVCRKYIVTNFSRTALNVERAEISDLYKEQKILERAEISEISDHYQEQPILKKIK